jgi:hypothetical protein
MANWLNDILGIGAGALTGNWGMAVPAVGDLLGGGSAADQAASNSATMYNNATAYANEYLKPYAVAGVNQNEAANAQYGTLNNYLTGMLGGVGAGDVNLPWYLQTPSGPSQAETDALSSLGRMGLQGSMDKQNAAMSQYYAQRGIPISQQQAGNLPGAQQAYQVASSQENANRTMTLADLAAKRRGEALQNITTISNLMNTMRAPGVEATNAMMGNASNQGAAANNQAQYLGNNYANSMSSLANQVGQYYANKKIPIANTSGGIAADTSPYGNGDYYTPPKNWLTSYSGYGVGQALGSSAGMPTYPSYGGY